MGGGGVDMAVRCRRSSPRRSHGIPRCRHSKPEEARESGEEVERGGGYGGREEGVVSRVRLLEASWIAREFGGTKSHKEHGAPCYKLLLGVRSGRGLGCQETVRRSVRGRWVVP